jgi:hypothetical protein
MKDDSDGIDDACRRCLDGRQPGEDHLRRLTARIVDEACRRRRLGVSDATRRPGLFLTYRAACAALAAAAVLVSAALWAVLPRRPGTDPSALGGGAAAAHGPASLAALGDARLANAMRLFAEADRLFPDALRWIAETNGDVRLGVDALPGGAEASAPPALVRLTVSRRDAAGGGWRVAWTSDVLVRAGDDVEAALSRKADNRLALWVFPLQDGKLSVQGGLSLAAPVRLAARLDAVVADGEAVEIAALRTPDAEYRVFQTVMLLKRTRS